MYNIILQSNVIMKSNFFFEIQNILDLKIFEYIIYSYIYIGNRGLSCLI